MIESEPIWPNRIFIPIQVGDLSSPVHRAMATPEKLQSADDPVCIAETICFDCGFAWQVIESVYGIIPTSCPNCSAASGVSITDVRRLGKHNQ